MYQAQYFSFLIYSQSLILDNSQVRFWRYARTVSLVDSATQNNSFSGLR